MNCTWKGCTALATLKMEFGAEPPHILCATHMAEVEKMCVQFDWPYKAVPLADQEYFSQLVSMVIDYAAIPSAKLPMITLRNHPLMGRGVEVVLGARREPAGWYCFIPRMDVNLMAGPKPTLEAAVDHWVIYNHQRFTTLLQKSKQGSLIPATAEEGTVLSNLFRVRSRS